MTQPLQAALGQCERHVAVLHAAVGELPHPLTAAHAASNDAPLVRLIDQFILRFLKLQDTLGEHVLRRFAVQTLGEPVSDLPLADVLNRLERFGYLDAAVWARWRALRNSLTHDYPEHPEIRAALLNEAVAATSALAGLVARIGSRRPA